MLVDIETYAFIRIRVDSFQFHTSSSNILRPVFFDDVRQNTNPARFANMFAKCNVFDEHVYQICANLAHQRVRH